MLPTETTAAASHTPHTPHTPAADALEGRSFSVRLMPKGECFSAPADLALLAAAERAGVFLLASSCRNGTCRTCICQLAKGEVRYSIEWPGLSADEMREGFILPCVAHAASDVVIDLPF